MTKSLDLMTKIQKPELGNYELEGIHAIYE